MAKALVFSSHILWESHYETELEIIQNHINAGDDVIQLVCNSSFEVCDTNGKHDFPKCVSCISKRQHGVSLLSQKIKQIPVISLSSEEKEIVKNFTWKSGSIEDLKAIHYQNYDIGYSVASSIISLLFNPNPDLEKNAGLVNQFFKSSLEVYFSIITHLKQHKPDVIYVFNGRLAQTKAAFKAAAHLGVKCLIHERGSTYKHYDLFENFLPHDILRMEGKIRDFWKDNTNEAFKRERSAFFYQQRRKGTILSWKSFTDKQMKGLLPEGFDLTKKNLVIYNSSEFEFTAVSPEWDNPIYANQNEGIIRIIESMQAYPEYHIYVRLHPNLAEADPENYHILKALSYDNLTLILPNDSIDSYHLLDNAYKVVTFGSTMAIEATYWKKVSIMAGHGFFENLDVVHKPINHQNMIEMILNDELQVKTGDGADIFGYFYADSGIFFQYYEPATYNTGSFKGEVLKTDLNSKSQKWMNRYWVYRKYSFLEKFLKKMVLKHID